jgi:hypothetical protein
LGVQREVAEPTAHAFHSSTPEAAGAVNDRANYLRHIAPNRNPMPSATASVV